MTGYRFSDEVRADERGAGDGGAVGRGGDEHGADHGAADERVPDEFVADEHDADERDTDQRDVHTGNGAIADATPKADVVSNATAVIDAKRKPLRDAASLTADFAKHGYPPALLFPRMPAAEQAAHHVDSSRRHSRPHHDLQRADRVGRRHRQQGDSGRATAARRRAAVMRLIGYGRSS
jgi:hypothetical protein